MKKIKLYNRDGANLWLERKELLVEPNISSWELKCDKNHKYCLEYIRVIGKYPDNIESIDPSGGPMLSVADEFENKYKIVKIYGIDNILISERNNNQ